MVYGGLKESVRLIFSNINTFYFRFKQDSQEDKENEISSVSAISQVDTRRLTLNVKKDVPTCNLYNSFFLCCMVALSFQHRENTKCPEYEEFYFSSN